MLMQCISVILFAAAGGYYFGQSIPAPPPPNSTVPLSATQPPKHDLSNTNLRAAWIDFETLLGRENISLEPSELESHAGSSWSSHPISANDVPFCVVKPKSTEEVSALMKICHERRIP